MQYKQSQEAFAEELERILMETDTSVRRLARLSGVSRRSLENWVYGHSPRPRHAEPILKIASALHLPAIDADRLLQSAGYPPLTELKLGDKKLPPDLLADWQLAPNRLLGQKSAALPVQHNLPTAATPFLGRDAERKELAILVRRPDLRLITVTGLGGAGKTRLALETARSLLTRFDHGVYFISLDYVTNAEGFWEAIIKGLHIPADGANSRQQIVEDYLRNKQILLLLDNFEHLMPLTSGIGRLLSRSQRLNLLITSRQALDLQTEQVYAIGGLSCEEGPNSPAFQLFVETARRRLPGYEPSTQEEQDIVTLCAAVDGLPLALELAATWSDVLSPQQILDHLQSDLHEVWHNTADRPERQQSLWDLFDYSWQMLPKQEQEAAMRLSVLRGSFTPSMAIAIAECQPGVLKLLLQTSVVKRTTGARLMIHPLVRQFLEQQVVLSGFDLEELETRFINVILAWTAEQSRLLRETFKTEHYQNLHREWQHIERAWWLAVERQCYDLLQSCWDILFYFEAGGTWGQGDAFYESTRRRIPATQRRMLARLDEAQALMAGRLYEMPRSVKLAQRSLETLEELGVDIEHDEAGAYARVILYLAKYAFNHSGIPEDQKKKLVHVASGYLSNFTELATALFQATRYCVDKDFKRATLSFQKLLGMFGPDTYVDPNLQNFLAVSLNAEGRAAAAQEHFRLALNRGLELNIFPAVVTATYELRLLEGPETTTQQCREVLEELALEMGSRRTVGRVAIINAIQYLNLGLFKRGSQLMRIGVGMVWNEVDNAERARILSTISQAYIAFGLIKTAPQVLSSLMPELSEQSA